MYTISKITDKMVFWDREARNAKTLLDFAICQQIANFWRDKLNERVERVMR